MLHNNPKLISQVRDRFAHVDHCPFEGKRIFFENAGGALTLNSVVETSAKFAAIHSRPPKTEKVKCYFGGGVKPQVKVNVIFHVSCDNAHVHDAYIM